MDQVIEAAATKIVEALVEDQAMFSAHDITTLLRADGLTVRHTGNGNVRDFVHDLMNHSNPMFADYNRDLNSDVGAFVYHHYNDDVNDYDSDEHRNATNVATGKAIGAPNNVAPNQNANTPTVDDGKVAVDQRGRLCIRAALLRQLGVRPGDLVAIDVDMAGIFKNVKSSSNVRFLTVDKDNCLRLSNSILYKTFGSPTPDRFELIFNTNSNEPFIEIQ